MHILWQYLRPYRGLVVLALLLAGIAQILTLVDPIIFGHILDEYALDPQGRSQSELVRGALSWLGLAAGIALVARLARTLQDYLLQLVTQRFGVQLFNDGLRHTMRLSFAEI